MTTLADQQGRRPLLVGGVLSCATAMFLTAFTQAPADLAPPSRMGEAVSHNSLGLYVGFALGPPLGELLVTSVSYSAAWYGASVLSLVAALIHRKAIALDLGLAGGPVPIGFAAPWACPRRKEEVLDSFSSSQ